MPDIPETSRREPVSAHPPGCRARASPLGAAPQYAELHCKTNFSFLEGASHPDELVARAIELDYTALAITDRNSLAGVVRAYSAAKETSFKLIVGAEITPIDAPPVVLWATDRKAYGRLARLITVGRRAAPKGACRLTFDEIAAHAEGLLAGVVASRSGGEREGESERFAEDTCLATLSLSHSSARRLPPPARESPCQLSRYREVFRDRCYLLAELYRGPDDDRRLEQLLQLSRRMRIALVAAGDVHYHCRSRLPLQDVLTAVRMGCTVAELSAGVPAKAGTPALFPNSERYLKSPEEMAARFARAPDAIRRTQEIADRCTFSLAELRYEYPVELAPLGESPLEYLTQLTWTGARKRYPQGIPAKVRGLIEHELALIGELRYEAYFLTVFDLVRFARRRGILCQGRGSAANSVVCFCLGVTSVDPEQIAVLFERFISKERGEAPDIDVDFEHQRREEVLQYLYEKYGRERVGMTAEVITYRPRSAVRDVGKALGLSLDRVDALAKNLDHYRGDPQLPDRCCEASIDPNSLLGQQLIARLVEITGFPRHLGQHVGGMVMTQGPLCELVPIENAAMDGRTVIEWDKDDLDELGILKVDVLSLGMLTAIHKSFELIEKHAGQSLTLATVPKEDPAVYAMICKADTMGVFQIESRAQMSMLPRLRPREFYDLVIQVAIVRPGPIQGNMVHPYLRRRAGEEPVSFPSEAIREVLGKTLGVPLFQEQAMRLAVVAAGFTPGEADQLRRAMGAWRRSGVIEQFRQKLIGGMTARGLSAEFAERVFLQIRGFGEYGFPESHAASFALLVYVSSWLKCYHMAAFTAALLNSQPMGCYAPAQLVRNARAHGVEVRGVDVNASGWDCSLEDCVAGGLARRRGATIDAQPASPSAKLRLGLRIISGLSESHVQAIVQARAGSRFRSWEDFLHRTRLGRAVLVKLAEADVFGSLGLSRRQALWHALAQDKRSQSLPLFAGSDVDQVSPLALPEMSMPEQVVADYQTAGMSLRAHPVSFHRARLDALGVIAANRLPRIRNGRMVRVAGLVLVRQRPSTAKGIMFVTLEDETGVSNLVVRQDVWARFHRVARTSTAMVAHGRLQSKQGVIHVLVAKLEDLSELLAGVSSQSRDFR